jgi:protein-disulfide isomerase
MPDPATAQSDCNDLVVPVGKVDHAQGPTEAPVTLVEYGDYECPDCFNALSIVAALRAHFGDSMRLIFRHFPRSSIHPGASTAAGAAEAAALQGHFWEMHEALFRRQRELIDVDLTHLALRLNLEVYRFERDRESEEIARRVRDDLDGGLRSGVHGTPTFFINDCRYSGPIDLPSLRAKIESVK